MSGRGVSLARGKNFESDPKKPDVCTGLIVFRTGTADDQGFHENLLENSIPIKYYLGVLKTLTHAEKDLLGEI